VAAQYELVINLKTAKAFGLDEFLHCDSAKMKTTGTSIPAVVVQSHHAEQTEWRIFQASPTEQPLLGLPTGARAMSRTRAEGYRHQAQACLAMARTVSTEEAVAFPVRS
jgi:hypothetical protein